MKIDSANIQTNKLLMRRFTHADAEGSFAVVSDAETMRFLDFGPFVSIEESRVWVDTICKNYDDGQLLWAIEDSQTKELIGTIRVYKINDDLSCEIAYIIKKACWGKGYATEAVNGLTQFLFEAGVKMVTAKHSLDNLASGKVLIKCGFAHCGVKEKSFKNKDGVWVDCAYYELIR